MRSGIGISSVNDGKVASTQEEAKEKQRGDRSRDKHRVGHRNRNTSTCGSEAGERERGITPPVPLSIICYMSPPSDEGNPCLDRGCGRAPA